MNTGLSGPSVHSPVFRLSWKGCLCRDTTMEELVLHSHLAPQLDSPPLSPKISAFRWAQLYCLQSADNCICR